MISCPPIMAVVGIYDAINDLLGMVGWSLSDFPLWSSIKPLFDELISFKNNTCSVSNLTEKYNVIKDGVSDVADLIEDKANLIDEQDYEKMSKDSKEAQASLVKTSIENKNLWKKIYYIILNKKIYL